VKSFTPDPQLRFVVTYAPLHPSPFPPCQLKFVEAVAASPIHWTGFLQVAADARARAAQREREGMLTTKAWKDRQASGHAKN
jgi:hypothetical protein